MNTVWTNWAPPVPFGALRGRRSLRSFVSGVSTSDEYLSRCLDQLAVRLAPELRLYGILIGVLSETRGESWK